MTRSGFLLCLSVQFGNPPKLLRVAPQQSHRLPQLGFSLRGCGIISAFCHANWTTQGFAKMCMPTGLDFWGLPWHLSLRFWLLLLCAEMNSVLPFACSCHRWKHSKSKSRYSHQICWYAKRIHSWNQRGSQLWLRGQVPLTVSMLFLFMQTLIQQITMLTRNLRGFSDGLEIVSGSLCPQDHCLRLSADSGRQFTFQAYLQSQKTFPFCLGKRFWSERLHDEKGKKNKKIDSLHVILRHLLCSWIY